jgi:hypothetical protein
MMAVPSAARLIAVERLANFAIGSTLRAIVEGFGGVTSLTAI